MSTKARTPRNIAWARKLYSTNLRVDSSIDHFLRSQDLLALLAPIKISEIAKRSIDDEFSLLKTLTTSPTHQGRLVSGADFKSKNRYSNVLPYRDSLVLLGDDELSFQSYINANFIRSPDKENDAKIFIATQGPLEATCADFWNMVAKYNVKLIVAIIEPSSLGSRCHDYWPSSGRPKSCGDFDIKELSAVHNKFAGIKTLEVRQRASGRVHEVTHAHLHNWEDHSALAEEDWARYVDFLKMMNMAAQGSDKSPIVVHCSAGIGRTGTLISSYFLFERWLRCKQEHREFEFSVFGLVRQVREQRYGAVQTLEQYAFLYEIVKHFDRLSALSSG